MSDHTAKARPAVPAQRADSNGGRTPAQIEADLAATREHLAATVDSLTERMKPGQLVSHGVARAKATVVNPEDGSIRTGRLVTAAAATAGVVGVLLVLRRVVRRGR